MNAAKRVATSLVALLLVGWSFPAIAQQDKVLQKLIEGAKKEAKLKLGLTMRWQEAGKPSGQKIVETFQARYPFVKVEYERVGGSRDAQATRGQRFRPAQRIRARLPLHPGRVRECGEEIGAERNRARVLQRVAGERGKRFARHVGQAQGQGPRRSRADDRSRPPG